MTTMAYIDFDAQHLPIHEEYFFGPQNENWVSNPEHNKFFLIAMENMHNDLLLARGHVMLNDVLDSLGIERTQSGAVIGWALAANNKKRLSFGIDEDSQTGGWILRFNTDGYILHFLPV